MTEEQWKQIVETALDNVSEERDLKQIYRKLINLMIEPVGSAAPTAVVNEFAKIARQTVEDITTTIVKNVELMSEVSAK